MKKHLSVLMLASRTVGWALAITLLTSAVQVALFMMAPTAMERPNLTGYTPEEVALFNAACYDYALEVVLDRAFVEVAAAVGITALGLMLCLRCAGFGSRTLYTVERLRVSERALNLWWAAYFAACLLIFWACQVLTMYLLGWLYLGRVDPAFVTGQTLALAWYRHPYLHFLMPGADLGLWIQNLLLLAVISFALVRFCMMQRRGKLDTMPLLALALLLVLFYGEEMGLLRILSTIALVPMLGGCAWSCWATDEPQRREAGL